MSDIQWMVFILLSLYFAGVIMDKLSPKSPRPLNPSLQGVNKFTEDLPSNHVVPVLGIPHPTTPGFFATQYQGMYGGSNHPKFPGQFYWQVTYSCTHPDPDSLITNPNALDDNTKPPFPCPECGPTPELDWLFSEDGKRIGWICHGCGQSEDYSLPEFNEVENQKKTFRSIDDE